MKTSLIVLLTILPVAAIAANQSAPTASAASADDQSTETMSPADKLAARLLEVANDKELTAKKKADLISTSVKTSFLAATVEVHDQNQLLTTALEFASVTTKVVPAYADVIGQALITIPQIAAIPDAVSQINTTIDAASLAATEVNVASAAPGQIRAPAASAFSGPIASEVLVPSNASPAATTQTSGSTSSTKNSQ